MLYPELNTRSLSFTDAKSQEQAITNAIKDVPNTVGVYYFYGDGMEPLYIGKSIRMRQRLTEHLKASKQTGELGRQQKFVPQTCVLAWRECLSETHALVLENREIKSVFPLFNRAQRRLKKFYSWQFSSDKAEQLELHSFDQKQGVDKLLKPSYGLYKNARSAKESIRSIADHEKLCLQVLGIDKGKGKCFRAQINKCAGACAGTESIDEMLTRLMDVLMPMTLEAWPFSEPLLWAEKEVWHVFYQWQLHGVFPRKPDQAQIEHAISTDQYVFDKDEYRIIRRALKMAYAPEAESLD